MVVTNKKPRIYVTSGMVATPYPLWWLHWTRGGGGYAAKFYAGKLCPELPFLKNPFQQDTPLHCLSYTFCGQMLHLSHTYIPLNCCKRHQFDVLSPCDILQVADAL